MGELNQKLGKLDGIMEIVNQYQQFYSSLKERIHKKQSIEELILTLPTDAQSLAREYAMHLPIPHSKQLSYYNYSIRYCLASSKFTNLNEPYILLELGFQDGTSKIVEMNKAELHSFIESLTEADNKMK